MKNLALILISTGAILYSQLALSSAGWTDYGNVAELIPTTRHYYRFRLSVDENPSGCNSENWFYQDYSSLGSDKMFTLLLEGLKSNLRLRVYVTGKCNIEGHSEISSIGIVP